MKTFDEILREQTLTNVPISNFFKHASVYAPFPVPPKKYLRKMKVDINDITPAQDSVHQEFVNKYAANPPKDLPIVVKMDDGRYIALNHTRISGQVQNGKTKIDVQVAGYNSEAAKYDGIYHQTINPAAKKKRTYYYKPEK